MLIASVPGICILSTFTVFSHLIPFRFMPDLDSAVYFKFERLLFFCATMF